MTSDATLRPDASGKVALHTRQVVDRNGWNAPTSIQMPVKRALPYFYSEAGRYAHRVRCATMYGYHDRGITHMGLGLWCGGMGFLSKLTGRGRTPGHLCAEPPLTRLVCAACEAKAVGAGYFSSIITLSRPIKFSPRTEAYR